MARDRRARSSRRSARRTTATARSSHSARIRDGGGSSSLALVVGADDRVLDVATGTGLVARELVRRFGCSVVGIDQSPEMLAVARNRARDTSGSSSWKDVPRRCRSPTTNSPSLTVTYLLRYVDDPAATVRELARVARLGGTVAMLEFAVPRGFWRLLWELWARFGLPGRRTL